MIVELEVIERVDNLNDRAVAAKHSEEKLELLIEDFKPFLHSRAVKYSFKNDEHQRDELYGTAMLAFYEAVINYDVEKGHFFQFADRVVRQRIIDYLRKLYRNSGKTTSLDDEHHENLSAQSNAVEEMSTQLFDDEQRRGAIALEIEQLKSELETWGITLDDLAKRSPKHKKLRETCRMVVASILRSEDIIQTIQLKRYFPIKAVSRISGFPPKKLERARTFILASLIIKMGDYELLSDFVGDGGEPT